MIMFYDLMHNHFDLDTSNLFSTATLLTTRGDNYKLFKPQATSRVRSTFLLYRLSMTGTVYLITWLINSPIPNDFKNSLDSSWST